MKNIWNRLRGSRLFILFCLAALGTGIYLKVHGAPISLTTAIGITIGTSVLGLLALASRGYALVVPPKRAPGDLSVYDERGQSMDPNLSRVVNEAFKSGRAVYGVVGDDGVFTWRYLDENQVTKPPEET